MSARLSATGSGRVALQKVTDSAPGTNGQTSTAAGGRGDYLEHFFAANLFSEDNCVMARTASVMNTRHVNIISAIFTASLGLILYALSFSVR